MAKAWKDGRYTPSAGDYMNVFTEDPVKWIGGRALGMHVHRRLRIFVDEDETRILYIEKWPLKYNYCIRYMMDKSGNMQKISGLFDLQEQMKRKILSLEFKSMLTEALEITEKEGIEVEGEEVAEKARRKRKTAKPSGKKRQGKTRETQVSKNAIAQQHSQRSESETDKQKR
jgi:hypothetical protein